MSASRYDRAFYLDQVRHSAASAAAVVPLVSELCAPQSVVDIGCGAGTWLRAFVDAGVTDVLGLDGSLVDDDLMQIDRGSFRQADFTRDFGVDRRFDLAMCLEVAEHLPADEAPAFVRRLTELAPVVLFSAAIPHQGGTGHVNERWPSYWAQLFDDAGFVMVDCLRPRLWSNEAIVAHYAQNIMLVVDCSLLGSYPEVATALETQRHEMLDVVHPRIFERKMRHAVLRTVAEKLPPSVKNSVTARLRGRSGFFSKI